MAKKWQKNGKKMAKNGKKWRPLPIQFQSRNWHQTNEKEAIKRRHRAPLEVEPTTRQRGERGRRQRRRRRRRRRHPIIHKRRSNV